MNVVFLAAWLLVLVEPLAAAGAADYSETAEAIVRLSGMRAGNAVDVSCGDGALMRALVKRTDLYIYGLAPEGKKLEEARRAVEAAGFYGGRAVVEKGGPSRLPYPDHSADWVVRGDGALLADKGGYDEVLRVLKPGGVAVLPAPREPSEVQERFASLGVAIQKDGLWLKIVKPRPRGMDDWTHWRHGPDNNLCSRDELVRPPFATRWIAEPNRTTAPMAVCAQGRLFLASGQSEKGVPWPLGFQVGEGEVRAVDGYDGRTLWRRPYSEPADRPCMVAVGESLYLLEGDRCLAMDGATGKVRGVFRVAEPIAGGAWVHVACVDGVLYGLLQKEKTEGRKWGRVFVAIESRDGRLVWSHTTPADVDSRSITIGDGRLFFVCPGRFAGAIDLRKGQVLWRNCEKEVLEAVGEGARAGYAGRDCCSVYFDGMVYLFSLPGGELALSAKDGRLAWRKTQYDKILPPRTSVAGFPVLDGMQPVRRLGLFHSGRLFYVGKGLYHVGQRANPILVADPKTGETSETIQANVSRCVAGTAAPSCLFYHYLGLRAYDLVNRTDCCYESFRSACNVGAIPANGLVYSIPYPCKCGHSVRGLIALASAGRADSMEERLERGDSAKLAAFSSAGAWPTCRGDNSRSGISPVSFRFPLRETWRFKTDGGITAPTLVGDLAFVGSARNKVYALDASTGQLRWKFLTGGSVSVPPTFWEGRAYFGSDDGWVSCVAASTGELLWRFRAAPAERRMFLYGRLVSLWPVRSGVIVANGVAYFCAGLLNHDGPRLCALDAQTGGVIWEKSIGAMDKEGRGISPQGPMALSEGRLYVPTGGDFPACFRTDDGSPAWWTLSEKGIAIRKYGFGSDLFVSGKTVFVGGRQMVGGGPYASFRDPKPEHYPLAGFIGQPYPYFLIHSQTGLPFSYDQRRKTPAFYLTHGWATPVAERESVYWATADSLVAASREILESTGNSPKENEENLKKATRWRVGLPMAANSLIMAGDVVLAAGAEPSPRLAAFSKSDGQPVWDREMQGKVIPNGLAAAETGLFASLESGEVVCLRW